MRAIDLKWRSYASAGSLEFPVCTPAHHSNVKKRMGAARLLAARQRGELLSGPSDRSQPGAHARGGVCAEGVAEWLWECLRGFPIGGVDRTGVACAPADS